MTSTPRLRSAFPQTPGSGQRWSPDPRRSYPSPQTSFASSRPSPYPTPIKQANNPTTMNNESLISLDVVDAPTQRFYIASLYVGLAAWRLYDFWNIQDDLDSTWLFLKWIGFDAAFFIGLPAFRIPWLQWSFGTTFAIWLLHAIANLFLMYRIPIPIGLWFGFLIKSFYDREAGLSSDRVNPAHIRSNSSIILGKQIIQILPEGSAILNPDRIPYCLNETTKSVELPIRINQTSPILIELLRIDLDTYQNETITINAKQARQMKRHADRGYHKSDTATPRTLKFSTSKTGLYQLLRVIDQSNLEVRRRSFDTAVVSCPRASVSVGNEHRCTGELSNVALEVTGVPPFRVRYSKRINKQQFSSITQSIQPNDLQSPLGLESPGNVVLEPSKPYLDWTNAKTVSVEINESLNKNGSWSYIVEEVEDGFGNRVSYDNTSPENIGVAHRQLQSLVVHNRPSVILEGCSAEKQLRVAKEDTVDLPIRLRPSGILPAQDWPLKLKYTFAPEDSNLTPEGREFSMPYAMLVPKINQAGRYSIDSVESQYCAGEVKEPSVCHLYNPPRPDLSIDAENIIDKCAGRPIGLMVNLDFTGTPPFKVRYITTHQGNKASRTMQFDGLRGQIELRETAAGAYKYEFQEIEDDVYAPISLKRKNLVLQQDIRPPASASFTQDTREIKACLGQPVALDVQLTGEGPWALEYEIVHNGKRKKSTVESERNKHSIVIPELNEGGKQSVILTSVQDKLKCRTPLRDERTIVVRAEQPHAYFGDVDGKRSILALEGKSLKLPLRLTGVSPWAVTVTNLDKAAEGAKQHMLKDANAMIQVDHPGTYEIQSVHDSCPGVVDPVANTFQVSWIERPRLQVNDATAAETHQDEYRKPAVCQGDEDAFTLHLSGNAPYSLKYQQRSEPIKGPHAVINKPLNVASSLALINLDTSRAGEYTYTFSELSDDRYGHDRKRFRPIVLRQQVYPLPVARFGSPGKTYGYCKDDTSGTENIPITLEGIPPFNIEIGITHHGAVKPEIIRVKDVMSNSFSWSLSRQGLDLGTHNVHIRSVTDSHGCEKIIDSDPSSVRIMVSNPPTIFPLESQSEYCVGERVSFSLSGQPPFEVFYRFQGKERKAKVPTTEFRRLAEAPGEFSIKAVSDSASGKCRAEKDITKIIHPMPSVKLSKGKIRQDLIQEGGEVELLFEFTGTPPFEFTYIRSEIAKRGKKAAVLETRNEKSYGFSKSIRATDEGTYEVVSIKDKYCSYTTPEQSGKAGGKTQKLLQY